MIYVFDSGPFIQIFRYYYPERFPSFWKRFNPLIEQKTIISVKEVARELSEREDNLTKWAKKHKSIFHAPTADELEFVSRIFEVAHFQLIIRKQERLEGRPVADPFVIAKAQSLDGCVISLEKFKENAAKIPNICEHFGVKHMHLRKFMEEVNWTF